MLLQISPSLDYHYQIARTLTISVHLRIVLVKMKGVVDSVIGVSHGIRIRS